MANRAKSPREARGSPRNSVVWFTSPQVTGPPVMALRLHTSLANQLGYTLVVGVIALVVGSGSSYALDLPTGVASMCISGALLVAQVAGKAA